MSLLWGFVGNMRLTIIICGGECKQVYSKIDFDYKLVSAIYFLQSMLSFVTFISSFFYMLLFALGF